jgi:hypothetical protein
MIACESAKDDVIQRLWHNGQQLTRILLGTRTVRCVSSIDPGGNCVTGNAELFLFI